MIARAGTAGAVGEGEARVSPTGQAREVRLVGVLGASVVVLALLMRHAGLSIAANGAALGFAAAFATLAGIRWAFARPATNAQRVVRDAAEYIGLSTAISLAGAVASYPVAAMSHGFVDAGLQRADLLLHFDWVAWYRAVATHPVLQLAGRAAYALIYLSPVALLGRYAISGQRAEAYRFMTAVWLAATATLAGFFFLPAIGPFGYLWHGDIPYVPVSDLWQPDLIPRLRAHAVGTIDLGHLVGLVSAPSFHTAAAVLMMGFGWRQPALRGPMLVANGGMLLATPVEGTHYLIDLVGGAGVALAALAAVHLPRRSAHQIAPSETRAAAIVSAGP